MHIRNMYKQMGVSGFYTSNIPYVNPHTKEIQTLICENHLDFDLTSVLDLGCGDGLVTKTLINLGYDNITGADPFLFQRYTKETGKKCLDMSFVDVVKYGFQTKFSCIICSFALHLCEQSMLKSLMYRLSECTNTFVVISPTKFPFIGKPNVERFCLTPREKRVMLRVYNLSL